MESEIVTISVMAYNSSKYILETLESIKNQSYQKIILQICDDCSTDNTISICKEWIETNKQRFVDIRIIVPEQNTGVAANCNRAWDSCDTTYHKGIAGDDILLPNCIEDNMCYMAKHPEAVVLFSKLITFGANKTVRDKYDMEVYDYKFFSLSSKEQFEQLYNGHCSIPAPSAFFNLKKIRELGLRHDERIPMQEDVAKWMNALRLNIKFHFLDIPTVKYRIHNGSLSTANVPSVLSRESVALTWFYYHFENEYGINPEKAIKEAVAREIDYYKAYYQTVNGPYYKLGYLLLTPIRWVRKIIKQ